MSFHGSVMKWQEDKASLIKTHLGLWLFFLYAFVYGGFILINITAPKLMAVDVGPLNVAIVYGFGLIIFALFLALFYNSVSSGAEKIFREENHALQKEDAL
ncbi:MAG: DUF485 domain-containing protein [Bacillota bacterium]|jgi:uncharacterized membrane protein (DUF485 family)|uniref:DUF485 domain-containing protein n=1 Tax=Thermanaerosceptrum fracticalcis TaxID=1712410 RepID=A0A7G6E6J0_THEFR|nr:DUF485 domain-containing protein [Thermanaerosceptrum fracticalcis]QNB47694.1 DUF485 domain-containing protein [Thermanaerosceptrum fracticalcis]